MPHIVITLDQSEGVQYGGSVEKEHEEVIILRAVEPHQYLERESLCSSTHHCAARVARVIGEGLRLSGT